MIDGASGVDLRDAAHLPYPSDCLDAVFMSFTLELFGADEIPLVLTKCKRVLRPGGRIAVAGMFKEGVGGMIVHVFEWTLQHFPNILDCRPIFVQKSLESAGYLIISAEGRNMWVPVEIVRGVKKDQQQSAGR